MQLTRRAFILLVFALGACAQLPPAGEPLPPIVFVHGNGDTAALWTTTLWRFESNGYERNLLHAIDFRYPLARNEEAKAQPLRASAAESMRELAAKVGLWGPFTAQLETHYEFVVTAPGHAVTHIYRSPFPRSSEFVHLRPADFAKGDEAAGSVVAITRPRGYFGHGRDVFTLDGKVPPGINQGVPGASLGKLLLPAGPPRPVPARFNDEAITVQNWTVKEGHIVFAEFHY